MATHNKIRIGTRGSPLAVAQAEETRENLKKSLQKDDSYFEIVIIESSGDKILDKPLREFGGKGLFTKEIEDALLDKDIDIAVHSMKDMPTMLPQGLEIACVLPREDVRDAFISNKYKSLDEMPEGATFGTSSLRRKAQLLAVRPDLNIVEFRGNVQTRLKKLEDGVADATMLACAGLKRLGKRDVITAAIDVDVMLPAVSQGAVGIECRSDNLTMVEALGHIDDHDTAICLDAERTFLAKLDGSCHTPIAALAIVKGMEMVFKGQVLLPNGTEHFEVMKKGTIFDAAKIGYQAAEELIDRAGPDFLAQIV